MDRRHSEQQTRRHRLVGHDYSDPGYYFVTFGTKNGRQLLGTLVDKRMILSPIGQVVEEMLTSLPKELEQMEIDCFALMPDHVHVLVYLIIDSEPISISDIVRLIKGRSAAMHRKLTDDRIGLWQKGFHDQIVRNESHLDSVRRYIVENPLRWKNDDRW